MGDRKTPYKFGNRVGPDIPRIVAEFPQDCRVHYKGNWYRFVTCSWEACPRHRKGFWRRYGDKINGRTATVNPKQLYCCESCADQAGRMLRNARQKRWYSKNKTYFRDRYATRQSQSRAKRRSR